MSNNSQQADDGNIHDNADKVEAEPERKVSFFTILASVFSSFFGVQNQKNRKRDFESGKFWQFFTAGLIFVLLFLLAVWGMVQYMLATTPTG